MENFVIFQMYLWIASLSIVIMSHTPAVVRPQTRTRRSHAVIIAWIVWSSLSVIPTHVHVGKAVRTRESKDMTGPKDWRNSAQKAEDMASVLASLYHLVCHDFYNKILKSIKLSGVIWKKIASVKFCAKFLIDMQQHKYEKLLSNWFVHR